MSRKKARSSSRIKKLKKHAPLLKKIGKAGGAIIDGHLQAMADVIDGYARAVRILTGGSNGKKEKK